MGTVIVVLILAAIVAAIIGSMVKARKRGQHPICGGDCGHCGGSCGCH
ncbi:MAG: FeoB-associated Cys-rich membrane protein [Pseudobutyrivibrio sp.]|nr:FeoB-associated Cys-rich membrane protein [Pseudobutyrivibrio sp.]MBP5324284.1 FeoB-associated Cys-rich membrane protein [Pseudobutyrivibrio sp.]MBQ7469971.1 FeoB-associated Cys-rich membrane protein [Pseudobutyrivibrio sp.]MBR5650227.1 FeoB-associated Cys-rich membrane protein [Pseudobutyrivibrio sp.]